MPKRKNVPAGANVLDMRHPKRSWPRDNAPASSDVAIPGTPSASQPILGVPLDAVPKHQRAALITYSEELRPSVLAPDSNIHLERYEGDSDQPDDQTIAQRLTNTPCKRERRKLYEQAPFQRVNPKKQKKGKEKKHTPSDQKDEEDDREPVNDPAVHPTSKKRRSGRQPDLHLTVGSRLTQKDNILMVGIALKYHTRYEMESMRRFWHRVREQFEKISKLPYKECQGL